MANASQFTAINSAWSFAYFTLQRSLTYGSTGGTFFSDRTYYFYVSWSDASFNPSGSSPLFYLRCRGFDYYPTLVSFFQNPSYGVYYGLYSFTPDVTIDSANTYIYFGYDSSSDIIPPADNAYHSFTFSVGVKDVTDSTETQTRELIDKFDQMTDFSESQQTELGGTVDSAGTDFESKLGVLSFADQALTDFISVFADDPGPAQLTLPGFVIEVDGEQHEVWADTPYSLASLEDDFGPLLTAVRFGLVVLVYAALIGYLGRVLDALLHGSDVKEE